MVARFKVNILNLELELPVVSPELICKEVERAGDRGRLRVIERSMLRLEEKGK